MLTKAGAPTPLGARAVAVLTVLVEQPNEYVPKDGIIDAAWPGVVVEESNLAVQISALRRVLSQAPGGERWIETLSGRGYRFVGPVTELPDDAQDTGSRHALESARAVDVVHRPRTRVGGDQAAVARQALVDTRRRGRHRQDAARVADGGRSDGCLPRRRVAGRAGVDQQSVAGADIGGASARGRRSERARRSSDTLCAHLKARQLLLILDNCEHLLDACATLAEAVLRSAAGTTILATSREPLHVAGEQTYPLQSLSLPEPSASAEAVSRSEAVQLFVERARRQLPDFELTTARTRRSPSCASTSTAFRWRWNWRRPEFARCRSSRSMLVCTIASSCSRARTARHCRASRRCAPRSTGATTCSPGPSDRCCNACRYLPEGGRLKRRKQVSAGERV